MLGLRDYRPKTNVRLNRPLIIIRSIRNVFGFLTL